MGGNSGDNQSCGSANKQFLKCFLSARSKIKRFILFLSPDPSDAEDIFQETATLMWEKFDEFEDGTNFTAWGSKIAMNKVMEFRKRKRKAEIQFDQEVLEKIIEAWQGGFGAEDEKRSALWKCLMKLRESDRALIKARYERGITINQIAKETQTSVHTLYKKMGRIHENLRQCINQTMAVWRAL